MIETLIGAAGAIFEIQVDARLETVEDGVQAHDNLHKEKQDKESERELGTAIRIIDALRKKLSEHGCQVLLFYSKVITTFPRACPSSRYRIASGTSLNL